MFKQPYLEIKMTMNYPMKVNYPMKMNYPMKNVTIESD